MEWNRGAYLVNGPAHCSECHTLRNRLGGFESGEFLAGTPHGPEGVVVPNITPDKRCGMGTWHKSDIVRYPSTGSLMAELIDNGLKYMPRADLDAISNYIADQMAVPNPARKGASKKKRRDDH